MAPDVQPAFAIRVRLFIERLTLAHMVAYPLALGWMCAAIPFSIHFFIRQIDMLEGDVNVLNRLVIPQAAWFVVKKAAWPGGAAFVLEHVAGMAWGVSRDGQRGKKLFLRTTIVLFAGCLALGAASWGWLYLR